MLDDTKGHFWKTISYFCHGNRQVGVHTCQYYYYHFIPKTEALVKIKRTLPSLCQAVINKFLEEAGLC